ncbi:unnamed protein product, partial [Rotaria sp. Silwood2]
MPTKARKKIQGPSLYKTFVDAYMKARPNEKRDVKHHNAQVEWNEEYVKEKIEEYLEIYNELDYRIKKRKPFDEELIEDLRELPPVGKIPLEPLSKTKRQPAQERAYNELNTISDRIASLVQVKQMGLFTAENRKQLKQLMKDRQTKTFGIKRLQSKQKASTRYKDRRKKIVDHLFETK